MQITLRPAPGWVAGFLHRCIQVQSTGWLYPSRYTERPCALKRLGSSSQRAVPGDHTALRRSLCRAWRMLHGLRYVPSMRRDAAGTFYGASFLAGSGNCLRRCYDRLLWQCPPSRISCLGFGSRISISMFFLSEDSWHDAVPSSCWSVRFWVKTRFPYWVALLLNGFSNVNGYATIDCTYESDRSSSVAGRPALVLLFPINREASVPNVSGTLLSHGTSNADEPINLSRPAGKRHV